MTVLITGSAGRIGRILATGLADRHQLRLTDLAVPSDNSFAALPFNAADLRHDDLAPLCKGVETIVHLAGNPNSRDWDIVEDTNVRAARRLIEAAARAGVNRFIFASSIHVSGYLPASTTFNDMAPYAPDSPYGYSKAAIEMLLRYAAERYGMTCVAVRICSFRPRPQNARELTTWLSPGDCVRLFDRAIVADIQGFLPAWGISANLRATVLGDAWKRLGYHPVDDAETFAPDLAKAGIDTGLISEWPYAGGHFIQAEL